MEQKQAIADRLKQSNNILVTVSNNPSVDQLAACIGLTLALNKMGKHATAVFSGNVPSTIEFLQPEKTLEKNTDSLRDFIIALDKSKADKLRYKVEDKVVKIFITPYKTSITEKDLDFSQGDFNVDVVLALGVHQQTDLDQAITAHGRILHDAMIATINTKPGGELGTINWLDNTASSLSELIVQLLDTLDNQIMDGQMATAFLTGIVAETNRFSNEKTTPQTMSISAELMGVGANQQLVATKLAEPATPPPPPVYQEAAPQHHAAAVSAEEQAIHDGTLEISHTPDESASPAAAPAEPEQPAERHDVVPPKEETEPETFEAPVEPPEAPKEPAMPQIHIDEHGSLRGLDELDGHQSSLPGTTDPTEHMASSHMILQPPASMAGQMNASGLPEDEAAADPLSLPQPAGQGFGGTDPFAVPSASASIAPPQMPYLPPSMTPGGGSGPALDAVSDAAAPSAPEPPAAPAPEPSTQPQNSPQGAPEPPPPAPQIVTPTAAPAPGTLDIPAPELPTVEPPQSAAPASETLSQIEADVHSPHLQQDPQLPPPQDVPPTFTPAPAQPPAPPAAPEAPAPDFTVPPQPPLSGQAEGATSPDLASARDAVMQAIAAQPTPPVGPEPIQALNAQPLGEPLHAADATAAAPEQPKPQINLDATANPTFTLPDVEPQNDGSHNQAPPASPPPMMPPSMPGQ